MNGFINVVNKHSQKDLKTPFSNFTYIAIEQFYSDSCYVNNFYSIIDETEKF